ncbi:hypothetical protein KIN20_028487 [Parelaphostrongylus tenuis]|uniref:Uncharacterized protein n=1 Tax=Parelaphostrongylus tenuis TaxID=148309 RepID=A0AAD5WEV1_PARTN|nr:hypothetical protein KIN20_028487 [Parelaphostrongylus tenuis]
MMPSYVKWVDLVGMDFPERVGGTRSDAKLRRTDFCAACVELPGCDDFCPLKWLFALPSCYGLNFGLCDRVFCQLVSCNRQEHKVQILYMAYTKQCGETEQ